MTTEAAVAGALDTRTTDERWTTWVARGAAHDRTTARRTTVVAAVAAGGLALWLAMLLMAR